jgi:hypothetical protein
MFDVAILGESHGCLYLWVFPAHLVFAHWSALRTLALLFQGWYGSYDHCPFSLYGTMYNPRLCHNFYSHSATASLCSKYVSDPAAFGAGPPTGTSILDGSKL